MRQDNQLIITCTPIFHASLNRMSKESDLLSQPINKLNSNNETKINSTDLSPITSSIIFMLKLLGKHSTNTKFAQELWNSNK